MNPPAAAASTGGGGHAAPPAAAPAYAPYPRLSPDEVAPPPPPPYHAATAAPSAYGGNPYISSPAGSAATAPKNTMDSVKDVLGKMGKRFGEAARKTETITGNFWQHLKTGPSITDAAMSRISQVTKVIAEGGYDKIFHQTFEVAPSEKLKKPYACYLSTSAGPVMGVLYLSNVKLAFCSDNPLAYQVGDKTEWSYYKETEEGLKLEEKAPVPEKQGALEDTPQAEENKENKDATANEEEEKEEDKSVSINEFLKPAEGERYYGGRGRGRGRGDRGGFRGGYGGGYHAPPAAPAIQDQSQFPSLGGK